MGNLLARGRLLLLDPRTVDIRCMYDERSHRRVVAAVNDDAWLDVFLWRDVAQDVQGAYTDYWMSPMRQLNEIEE